MISGSAKATTPFGVISGRTPIHVRYGGDDLAVTSFQCGSTPVVFALSGDDLTAYIRVLIATLAVAKRAEFEDLLDDALCEVAS